LTNPLRAAGFPFKVEFIIDVERRLVESCSGCLGRLGGSQYFGLFGIGSIIFGFGIGGVGNGLALIKRINRIGFPAVRFVRRQMTEIGIRNAEVGRKKSEFGKYQ